MKRAALILSAFLLAAPLRAGSEGTSAVPILDMGAGARALAIGGAVTADVSGADSLFWNPAGLATESRVDVTLSHRPLLDVLDHDSGAVAWPAGRARVGVGYAQLKSDTFSALDANGLPDGSFRASDQVFRAAAAQRFGGWQAGVGASWVRSSLADVSASAWALSAGAQSPWILNERVRLGAAVRNVGSGIDYGHGREDLPRRLTAGATMKAGRAVRISADAAHTEAGVDLALGLESTLPLAVDRAAYLRGGFSTERRDVGTGFSFGGGLDLGALRLDFAWISDDDFGGSQVFTAGYRFGKKADDRRAAAPPEIRPADPRRAVAEVKPGQRRVYIVRPGDTLARIAALQYGDWRMWKLIYASNRHVLDNPSRLETGVRLSLPARP